MIGEQIREIRKQRGISLSKLAQLSGISKSYLSYVERDIKKNPSIDVVKKISAVLEIPIELLVSRPFHQQVQLDEDWIRLMKKAISMGVTKEQFQQFLTYWLTTKETEQ